MDVSPFCKLRMMPEGTKAGELALERHGYQSRRKPVDSRYVTALFRSPDAAERAYRAALALATRMQTSTVVSSDATRDGCSPMRAHPNSAATPPRAREQPTKGADLGGPTGGTFGTIAPVLAAVGAAVLVPAWCSPDRLRCD
jgi:hypothetical protein